MALTAYLKIRGAKQGEIAGSCIQRGREKSIEVVGYNHEISSPRDAASGLATGKMRHGVFRILKPVDKSTVRLYTALTTNETLTTFELKCFTPARAGATTGSEVNHLNIVLTNATVVRIGTVMHNNLIAESARLPQMEEIDFTYQRIEWTWVDGGITANDDWEA